MEINPVTYINEVLRKILSTLFGEQNESFADEFGEWLQSQNRKKQNNKAVSLDSSKQIH